MTGKLWQLNLLNQIDEKIMSLEKEKKSLVSPDEAEAKCLETEKEIAALAESKKSKEKEIKKKEIDVEGHVSHRKKFETKLYNGKTTNPKELQSFKEEVELLRGKQNEIEEEILFLMEEIEETDGKIKETEKKLADEKTEAEKIKKVFEEENSRINKAIEENNEKRKKLTEKIDADMLKKYEQTRAFKNGHALSHIKNESCGMCGVLVPKSIINAVRKNELRTCGSCYRILYLDA